MPTGTDSLANSKLLAFFQALRTDELRWFRDFVDSPYFNKHAISRRLCRELITAYRQGFPDRLLDKEVLARALFPEESGESAQRKLRHAMSELYRLGLRFLAERTWEADGQAVELTTLQALTDRQLQPGWHRQWRRCEQALQRPVTLRDLWQRYRLHEIAEQHYGQQRDRDVNTAYLQRTADQLDAFYVTRRLGLGCAMLTRQHALNEQYELHFAGGLPYPSPDAPQATITQLYRQLFDLLQREGDTIALQAFQQLVMKHAAEIGKEGTQQLIYFAINYCVQQIRKGYRAFTAHLLDLYETGLREGHLLEDGRLSPWNYKNIVKLGLGLRRFQWVESFLRDYTDHLPDEHRQDAFHFNRADLHYHRKDYDQALEHLNQVEFTDLHYQLGARAMLVKIYYETGAEEAFLSLLQSFDLYLRRNKVAGADIRQAYLHFLRFAKRLHRCKPDRMARLQQEISQTPTLSDRSWLLLQLQAKTIASAQ